MSDDELDAIFIDENVPVKDSEQFYAEQNQETEEPTELDLLKIENAQLKDAMHKVQHFQPASKVEQDDVNTVTVRAGVGAIENLIRLEIPKLRNRGWKTVEITMRAV
jgi:hypothetical protein